MCVCVVVAFADGPRESRCEDIFCMCVKLLSGAVVVQVQTSFFLVFVCVRFDERTNSVFHLELQFK